MMLPFLNSLVTRIARGSNQTGINKDGTSYKVPDILTMFLNDGQLVELVAATGVMGDATPLDGNKLPDEEGNWKYRSSRFVSMRGTVAFERLSCSPTSISSQEGKFVRILLNDAVYPHPFCFSGPGKTCPMTMYQSLTAKKLASAGDLRKKCNVSAAVIAGAAGNGTIGDGSGRMVGKGASFLGDLRGSWLGSVIP
jgi:acid phosphatase